MSLCIWLYFLKDFYVYFFDKYFCIYGLTLECKVSLVSLKNQATQLSENTSHSSNLMRQKLDIDYTLHKIL